MVRIDLVRSDEQAAIVYTLAYEFIGWLRARYPDMSQEIDNYLEHQKFDDQIGQVLIHYNPPRGECLLATSDGSAIGILMLKRLEDDVCEMNRMFVRESARGLGAGRAMVARLKQCARQMGFKSMVLSALPRHHEAIALYRSQGFEIDDLQSEEENSDNSIFMRLDL